MIEENAPGLRAGWFFRTALLLCLLIIVYFGLVSTASLWPKGKLDEHLREASALLSEEGWTWMPFGTMAPIMPEMNATMLNITGTLNPDAPLHSAMRMDISCVSEDMGSLTPPSTPAFEKFVSGETTAKWNYARYWHGYTAVLRPLLAVMSFPDVRKLFFFCLMALFSVATILLTLRVDWVAALGFALTMALSSFPLVAFSLDYADNFVVALTLMCSILRWNIKDEECLVRLFLLSGSLTVFIGFGGVNEPIVTFMLPLLAMLLPEMKRQPCWDRRRVKNILLLGVVWSAGFLLTWAAKWVLADVVLGEDVMRDAINQIFLRTGRAEGMTFFDKMLAIIKNIYVMMPFSVAASGGRRMSEVIVAVIYRIRDTENLTWLDKLTLMIKEVSPLLPSSIFIGVIVTTLVVAVYLIIIAALAADRKKRKPIGTLGYFSLTFLFLIPYFWYFITANHATIHYYFTFRNQISSVWLFLILPHIMRKERTD
jgi:hypothetical protein